MASKQEKKSSSGVAEFVAGCMGGFAQVMIGQPFDIVKVRLQTQKPGETTYTGAVDCFKKIIQNEGGVKSLWRGSLPPLIGVGAATSIQFGVNENTKAVMQEITKTKDLSMFHLAICGAIAGLANSVVSTSAEHIRIRMQSQGTMANPPYSSSIDCAKKIFNQYGFKGVYKGGIATLWREAFAYATYFSVYDWTLRKSSAGEKPSILKICCSGALAGVCFWTVVFPIDVVKTKIQTDNFANPQYKGVIDCFSQTYKSQGLGGFWRGYIPCLMRAVPANMGTFLVYEMTLGLLKGKGKNENDLNLA